MYILLSENPNVQKATRIVDEQKGRTEEARKSLRNERLTEKRHEYNRGVQTKNGKERAAGEEQTEVHLLYAMSKDGRAAGAAGHLPAVVAYRAGQLYCICTKL